MLSRGHTQRTASWAQASVHSKPPIFVNIIVLVRGIWTAHVNDRTRNDRIARATQLGGFHSCSTIDRSIDRRETICPRGTRSIYFSSSSRNQEHEGSSTAANAHLELSEKVSSKETEENLSIYRPAAPSLPDSTSNFEKLHKNATTRSWPPPAVQWIKRYRYNVIIERQIQDKSARSYDWSGVLRLLKAHYRPACVESQSDENRSTEELADTKPHFSTDAISEPESWTKATFDRYVNDLIKVLRPTTPLAKALRLRKQRRGPCNVKDIGQSLQVLFHRKDMRYFIEPKVCNAAIEFLSRHALLSRARSILLVMEDLSIFIPVSTYNIFMRAAAHHKDLHTFSLLLDTMIKRGVAPNAETWVVFVRCLDSIATRRLVIAEMATLDILHQPSITTKVISSTVKDDLIEHLAARRDAGGFPLAMRVKYGPRWMSSRTGNLILNEVCKRVSLSAGLDLVKPLTQHGFTPHAFTMNMFFFQALETGRDPLPLAIFILEVFTERYSIHVNPELWTPLFLRARRSGYLNVARVVWIAACLKGRVTHKMKNAVLYSLQQSAIHHNTTKHAPRNPELYPQPPYKLLKSFMGRFLLGLDPLKYTSWREGLRALDRCIRMAYTSKLRFSLTFNLQEAYKVDREWKGGNVKDLPVMMQYRYPLLRDKYGPKRNAAYLLIRT